jgi:hypothetical protein
VARRLVTGSDCAYYTYVAWGDDQAALMSNGSGDEHSIVFTDAGVFIRMFDHESDMTPYANDDHALWPGLLDGLPPEFRPYVTEPAFCDEGKLNATAVLWRRAGDDRWHAGAGITSHRHEVLTTTAPTAPTDSPSWTTTSSTTTFTSPGTTTRSRSTGQP